MIEYLMAVAETSLPIPAVSVGSSLLMHVFTLLSQKPNVYYQCQKAYYYYLEYLDQVDKSNLSHKLGYASASIFVYEKIFVDLSDNNIIAGNESIITGNTVQTLFFWNHPKMTIQERITLCEKHMIGIVGACTKHPVLLDKIEKIQETLVNVITFHEYDVFLSKIIDRVYDRTYVVKKGVSIDQLIHDCIIDAASSS
jgi:hypothetical protein